MKIKYIWPNTYLTFGLFWLKLNIYKQGFFNTYIRNKVQENISSGKYT